MDAPSPDRRPAEQEVAQRMTRGSKSSDEGTPADQRLNLLGERLDAIVTRPVDVSSFTDAQLGSDLKDLSDRLQKEIMKLSSGEAGPLERSPCWRRVQRLGQRLERVQSALRSLGGLLAALREAEAERPALLPGRRDRRTEAQRATEQRVQALVEQAEDADGRLRAAGMSVTLHGVDVDCCCLTMMSTQRLADLIGDEDSDQVFHPAEAGHFGDDSSQAKRRDDDDDDAQGDFRGGASMGEDEPEERVRRRTSLVRVLEEIRGCAEDLQLQEATLPALQQRQRVLERLQEQLSDRLPELDALSEGGGSALSHVWEESSRAVTDRLDHCSALTELIQKFQSLSSKLRSALLRADRRVAERKFYMSREKLEKMHSQVDESKAELVSLVATIGGLRSTCRKLHTHLRHVPGCPVDPYEEEADALMDQWLDICEKTDCRLEILHRVLALWEDALQLGVELETRTGFASDSEAHPEESLEVLQRELQTQEEIRRAFHRRLTEIQLLLQSSEPPLELQVVETQMLRKMQQLREDVCLQEKTVVQEEELEQEDKAAEHQQQEEPEEPRADGTRPCGNQKGGSLAALDAQDGSAEERDKASRLNSDTCWPEEALPASAGEYLRNRGALPPGAGVPAVLQPTEVTCPGASAGGGAGAEPREEVPGLNKADPGADGQRPGPQGGDSRRTPSGGPDVPGGSQVDRSLLELGFGEPSAREVKHSDLSLTPSTIRILVTSEDLVSLPPALEPYLGHHTSEMDILKAIDDALEEDEKLCFDTFMAGGDSRHCSPSGTPTGRSSTPTLRDQPGPSPPASCGVPASASAGAGLKSLQTLETMERVESGNSSEGLEETSSLDVTPTQSRADMDAERTRDSPGARSCRQQLTMQDVWSGIPAAVEGSDIIRRAPQLHSYPDESEVCLVRLVQKVLVCRYQPAQLEAAAMARQLKEAEELKSSVEQQAALLRSAGSLAHPVKVREELLTAALLDASATVQVKAAQLDQVTHFHRQMRTIKAFLEVVSEEHQTSLASSESGAERADHLQALRQTMEGKTEMMAELQQLTGHLSTHLSGSESSGALFAQIGDVQEQWRCLEERLKRDLQQTLNGVLRASRLVSGAQQLQDKVEAAQESIVSFSEPHEVQRCVDLAVMAGDLKLFQKQHLHLQSEAEALACFSPAPAEKHAVEQPLQELASTLSSARCSLDGVPPPCLLSKQVLDLIRWLKQAEVQIWAGQSMSLFPEEARCQIAEMRKLQTDVLSRRSKMEVEGSDMKEEDLQEALEGVADLFDAVTRSVSLVLGAMRTGLQEREELLCQLAGLDVWLSEAQAERLSHAELENICDRPAVELQRMLDSHTSAVAQIQMKLGLVEQLESRSQEWTAGLSLEESRYLANRLSGLWTQLDRRLGFERAAEWEVHELIHERTASETELAALEDSLKDISAQMEQLKFPVTQETHLTIAQLKHQLVERQCQVQEVRHCQESRRGSLLRGIGELQDRCKALSLHASEQEQYLQLRKRLERSRGRSREQMRRSRDKQHSIGQRFRLCQALLVELPSLKTLCQEAADQLEAISQDLQPLDLNSERQRIRRTVDTLVVRELSMTDDIRTLEAKLLLGLRFSSELSSLTEFFQDTRRELRDPDALRPDEEAIDAALRRCWVLWRNMDSGMRVFEALRRKRKLKSSDFGQLYALKEAAVLECQAHMENLSQARDSLKDFQWAAQGAIAFLRDAEATFLLAHGGFLDCSQEHRETLRALQVLEEGFQSHMDHLEDLVPRHPCLAREETGQLHIGVLGQLVVGRAVLEAQAQLRLESLQRCQVHQEQHEVRLDHLKQHLSGLEAKLSECSGEHVTSLDEATTQHGRAQVLMEELSSLAGKVEDQRAGCPTLGCGLGKDGGLSVVWRHWMFLRHHACLLMAQTEHRREEWKDIQKSMERSCSFLSGLQAELADSSAVRLSPEKPQTLLDRAERQQARLECERRAVASLQHRLEHAVFLSGPRDPGPARHVLQKLQEDVRSLTVRNTLVVAEAEAQQKDRTQLEEKLAELEGGVQSRDSLSAQKIREERAALKLIVDRPLPSDLGRRTEDEAIAGSGPVRGLVSRVAELGSGLEDVKKLLRLRSPSVAEAQAALKHVWDELDTCHTRLALLESDVQDLVEDRPDQAHLFMDQLTQPLQLYQDVAKMAEQRTNFLSKIPACLQQFEDLQHSAACWLEEAQSWISAPSSFTSARSLQNYGNALQVVLDDSGRIRDALRDFRPVLAEVSPVCDVADQETRLDQSDQRVRTMQRSVLEPLELLQQAAAVVEAMETELKTLERNVLKIQAILGSVENPSIPPSEHLNNRQVILANLQSMRRTLEDMQSCRGELHLPPRAHDSLQVFSRVEVLLQTLRGLEQLTQDQVALLESETVEDSRDAASSRSRDALEEGISEEDEDDEDDRSSSSSDTLTCSLPEDPEQLCAVSEDEAAMKATSVFEESRGPVCGSGDNNREQAAQSPARLSGSEAQTSSPVKPELQPEETLGAEGPVGQAAGVDPPGGEEKPTHHGATPEPPASDSLVPGEPSSGLLAPLDSPTAPGPDAAEACSPPSLHRRRDQGDEAGSALCGDEPEGPLESPEEPRRIEEGGGTGGLLQLASTSDRTRDQPPAPGPDHACDVPGEDEAGLASWLCGLSAWAGAETSPAGAPRLQLCELDPAEDKVLLLEVSQALLQGMVQLLDLAEDRAAGQLKTQSSSRSQLQAAVCRHKKLQKLLRSQLSFVQHLGQREPEVLQGQEEVLVQVKARVGALLEQEVAAERDLQVWTCWEDDCRQLNRILDRLEVVVCAEDPQSEDEEEAARQQKLRSCQQAVLQLEESRAALGRILELRERLRAGGEAGGALALRWQSLHRRLEQEIRRCRDVQESQSRFLSHCGAISHRLMRARERLTDLQLTSDLDQQGACRNLVLLLDLGSEVESMSVQRAAARSLALGDADCPSLRRQRDQLEADWSQLTSDLWKTQEQLQQHLLLSWPPLELLSHLELWIQRSADRLAEEREAAARAEDAAQIRTSLQNHQELRAGVVSGQLLLDFLTQPGPQAAGEEVRTLRSTRTGFAERVGAVRLTWSSQQSDVRRQICRLEQLLHTCSLRERQLLRLQRLLEEQEKLLSRRQHPHSRAEARLLLQNWEVDVGGLERASAELLQLTPTSASEAELRCDQVFSGRAESLRGSCEDLLQQAKHLKSSLLRTADDWDQLETSLRDVSLLTTRVRCSLQLQSEAPLLSLAQTEELIRSLQGLLEEAAEGEGLWARTLRSSHCLLDSLDPSSARTLRSDVEAEQKRWSDAQQQLKAVLARTREILPLWRDHQHLWDICSEQLKQLRAQRGAPWDSADPNMEAPAAELRNRLEPVLASSRSLVRRLDPLGAELVRSGSLLLSRDVSRLTRATSDRRRLLEEQRAFHSQLEQFEGQMEKILLDHQANDPESAKRQLLQLSGLLPTLLLLQESSASERSTEALSGRWRHSVARLCGAFSQLQAESLQSLPPLQKIRLLTSTSENITQMLSSSSDSDLQDVVCQHQELGLELMTGNLLLQLLLQQAAELRAEDERSQLLTLKETWTRSQALALRRQESNREQLSQWRHYRRGSRQMWALLQEVDSLLPPDGAEQMTLPELLAGVDQNQGGADALARQCGALAVALQAGRRVCGSELKDVEEAWSRTSRRLELRRDAVRSAAQKWTGCRAAMTKIRSELGELRSRLCEPWQESEEERLLQDSEVSLHLLSCGLRDAGGMKADLTGYMLTGDSALLEQQLEQLHGQWEELCLKVSSRRQEIADRLSAWTIFNDKNKELCDWLTQMESKACQRGDLSVEEMVEKLKKDCMEEINLFSENKSHLKQLGEQLLTASDEAKQSQVRGSLQEVHQRWHNLFQHIEARVKKLKETLATVQQLDKNMSNLRAWLSRVEAELSRPVTYSECHHQEIQRRLAEQQELQRDIEQHTEGVASVLSLCDVLLRDEDAAVAAETESDSLQETSRSLDQRWRTICALALDRRLRIEETWRLWCKFLEDYSRFEDWLKMAEVTAANPSSSDVPYSVAREELKKFEGFQRQVHERLTQLELVNNQYRRLARENRTDRASQIRAMVNKGNQRWDTLHRRVAAVLRRLKHFTGQREEFESTRESMLVWLTELDLQLTNVEHFSESDVHHKIQQLSSFQKEITVNTERIDGLIVFGEGLIQKSSPQDAALIEEELEELHSYCQEVFGRLVRFHQRLSQPPITEEPELSSLSLESSLELIGRPWLGRSLPATPSHLLTSPLSRSGRETPVSVDSLPLEWDHTGDVGGSSSHEDEEDELDDEGSYFSTLSAPRWRAAGDPDPEAVQQAEAPPTLTSTPLKPASVGHTPGRHQTDPHSCAEEPRLVSLDGLEQPDTPGLTGLQASELQSGVIERWELIQAQSRNQQHSGLSDSDLDDVTSWLEAVVPELERHLQSDPTGMDELSACARDLKETQRESSHIKSLVLSLNLRAPSEPGQQERLVLVNRAWSRVCTGLQQWDARLRTRLLRCQEFHQSLHSLLLWLAHAESRRFAVDIRDPETPVGALRRHRRTLTDLQGELQERRVQREALHVLWSQLRPENEADDGEESQEKIHVTGTKVASLLAQVQDDLELLRRRLGAVPDAASPDGTAADDSNNSSDPRRERSAASPPRSFFGRVLRAALPLHVLLLFLLLLPCLLPLGLSESGCSDVNNFARSFHPMLRYTNGPPPT